MIVELLRTPSTKLFGNSGEVKNQGSESGQEGSKASRPCFFGAKKRPIGTVAIHFIRLRTPSFGAHPDFPKSFYAKFAEDLHHVADRCTIQAQVKCCPGAFIAWDTSESSNGIVH